MQRRVRPRDEKHGQIREYLSETRNPVTQEDRRLKFKASRQYEILNGKLFTRVMPGAKGAAKIARYMPRDEEVFDIVTSAHLGLLHPGIHKTFYEIEQTIAGISLKEVVEL